VEIHHRMLAQNGQSTNTGVSSKLVFVVARCKNQHAFRQTSFVEVLCSDEYALSAS
jgi:hypothetical protein